MAPLHNIYQHWEIASLALKFGKYHSPYVGPPLQKWTIHNMLTVYPSRVKGVGLWSKQFFSNKKLVLANQCQVPYPHNWMSSKYDSLMSVIQLRGTTMQRISIVGIMGPIYIG